MFVVLLRFSSNRSLAGQFMQDHNAWIKRGLDDGVFVLVGSLQPNAGGAIIAHNASISELRDRIDADPFVKHDVVSVEILEIAPGRADERLKFLLAA